MAEISTYTQAIAQNIVTARTRCGLTQRGMASRMQALGFEWQQQTVARVELAKRPVNPEEILGLAHALETTIQELLSPSETDRETPLALPSGETVTPDYVTRLVYGVVRGAVTWTAGKPEFGPETQRTFPYTRQFGDIMRTASSNRPTTIRVDTGGSAVSFTWQPVPVPPESGLHVIQSGGWPQGLQSGTARKERESAQSPDRDAH